MIDRIKCNMATLASDADEVKANIKIMEESLSDIISCKAKLDSEWDGDASEAFLQELDQEIKQMQNIIDRLKLLAQYEDTSTDTYNNGEKSIAGMISEVSIA
ncbi:MAG: WXG100 family type VII secretion target [Lachnospiraceae bacterium]|nr:WXG100 family type VII secretion target [Lachnospiraceae bacterium]